MASQRPTTGRRGRPPHPDILTPAEWRVLDLLREGLSNPEIAERLALSRDTVKTHVGAILAKLGVASREEAAAWEPEAELRPWWAAGVGWLRPVTLGKAALVGASLVVLAGMGVLAWGVLRTSDEVGLPVGVQISFLGPVGDAWLIAPDGTGLTSLGLTAKVDDGFIDPPVWSPDGQRFAFLGNDGNLTPSVSVYLADAVTTNPVKVGGYFGSDSLGQCVTGQSITWSPDGSRFAYYSARATYIVDTASPIARRFADGYGPTWSPDGKTIVYATEYVELGDVVSTDSLCAIMSASTDDPSEARKIAAGIGPVLSPDGSYIAYNFDGQLVVADINGEMLKSIDVRYGTRTSGRITWSPDSTRIATTAATGVVVVDVATGETVELATGGGPQWSPDGKWIVYTRTDVDAAATLDSRGARADRSMIYLVRANGGSEPIQLTEGGYPSWRRVPEESVTTSAVDLFELESYKRIDPDADPNGGGPAYVVGREIFIRMHSSFVKRIEIVAGIGSQDNAASASVFPDSDGYATVTLTLPEVGVIYVVQGYGISVDDRPLQPG